MKNLGRKNEYWYTLFQFTLWNAAAETKSQTLPLKVLEIGFIFFYNCRFFKFTYKFYVKLFFCVNFNFIFVLYKEKKSRPTLLVFNDSSVGLIRESAS